MGRVICAGHVNWDVTLRVDSLPAPDGEATVRSKRGSCGGSAANVAGTLAGLDVPAAVLGSVGDGRRGRTVRATLTEAGVDCAHLVSVSESAGSTAVKYLAVDDAGEVMMFDCGGANEAYDAGTLPDGALSAAAHLHLTGQDPETAAALAERATDAGAAVSFDPGRRVEDRPFGPVFERTDLVFLNDSEAAAAVADAGRCREALVVKRGAGGAEVRTADGTYTHPGFAVDPVDTTGAGDAFAAGFLAAHLDGVDHARTLAVANACGALASRARGARAAFSWDDVDELLASEGFERA